MTVFLSKSAVDFLKRPIDQGSSLNTQHSTLNIPPPETALDASGALPSYTADFHPEPSRVRNPDTLPTMSLRTVFSTATIAAALTASILAQAPTPPIVKQIDVQYAGANTVSKEKLIANMRTRVGKPYDERAVEEDIRNLYATGNISNVRIFGEPTADGVKVIVVVQPKAQITEVALVGVTKFKESRIRKEISAKSGDALSEASLEADKQKIADYYAGKGFGEAEVTYKVEAIEKAGTARVVFTVSEGGKLAIKSVVFEGNTVFKQSELKKAVKSKPKGLLDMFSKTGRLDQDALNEDTRALHDLYLGKGYIDALSDTGLEPDRRVEVTHCPWCETPADDHFRYCPKCGRALAAVRIYRELLERGLEEREVRALLVRAGFEPF